MSEAKSSREKRKAASELAGYHVAPGEGAKEAGMKRQRGSVVVTGRGSTYTPAPERVLVTTVCRDAYADDPNRERPSGAEGVAVSSTCAVFAESEVISLLASGHPVEMIVKGIHRSLATRVASLIRSVDRDAELFMSAAPGP